MLCQAHNTIPIILLPWALLSALAPDPMSVSTGSAFPVGSLGWLQPLQWLHPTVHSLISQRRLLPGNAAGDCISPWLGPASSGPGPTGREGGQPEPSLGGGGQEPGNVTPHLRQIYQLSMGPVVAGDLISLGLQGGQENKAAWSQPFP